MPNEIIYRLREEIEDRDASQGGGINAYLTAQGLTVFTRVNSIDEWYKVRPRVELKASIGQATGHRFMCPDGILRYDYFHFTLALQVVTEPRNIPANNEQHELMLATARNVLSGIGGPNTFGDTGNFPNIYFGEYLRDTGVGDSAIDEEKELEYTVISYEGIVCIRPTAWN